MAQNGSTRPAGNADSLQRQRKAAQRRRKEIRRKRRRNRRILISLIFLIIVVAAFLLIRHLNGSESVSTETELDYMDLADYDEEENYSGDPVAYLLFGGDASVSLDQVTDATQSDGNIDFTDAFSGIADLVSSADYACADFESNILGSRPYGGDPYYNAPAEFAGAIAALGFDLVSTANTVMLNNGIEGMISTLEYLDQARLHTVGAYASQEDRETDGGAYIRKIHGITFAFLAYSKGTDSVTMPSGCEYAMNTLYEDYSEYWEDLREDQIAEDVDAARDAGAEVVIALVHWGSEYGRSVTASQEEAAEYLVECGVDVVIGSHSHTVQEMGYVTVDMADGTKNRGFVAYGVGNLMGDPEKSSAQTAVLVGLEFTRQTNGSVTITNAEYIPIYESIEKVVGSSEKHYYLVDVYSKLAELKRSDKLTSTEATLYNNLLTAIEDVHEYAGEELDRGPADEDLRIVNQAIADGAISSSEIAQLKDEEATWAATANDIIDGNKTDDEEEDELAEQAAAAEAAEDAEPIETYGD